MTDKPCIAIISPFIDKRHGTERCIAEQVERLAADYEIHIYSTRVEDVDLYKGNIIWHRIPDIPGPHLLKYLWWFVANHLWRWWDRTFQGLRYDLIYSPGINCLDANVVSVHIVFAEFYRRVREELRLLRNPPRSWPRLIHRWLYYHLIMLLERQIYMRKDLLLAVISRKTAEDLKRFYGRGDHLPVVYHGIEMACFNPAARRARRTEARQALGIGENAFVLLLIGNDWKTKGLPCLLEAMERLRLPDVCLLVVGRDDPRPYRELIRRHGLEGQVRFLPTRSDVLFYYAAADLYVAPSLEDAFALPPAEAMACGLPVIVSSRAGVSEIVTDGVDGLILQDPRNPDELAGKIRQLYEDTNLRQRHAENAANTARRYTWERSAEAMREIFEVVLARERTAT
jgi:UDP-glucose:(heptosyl)LPS alpha-1,3-glucosyltransferase